MQTASAFSTHVYRYHREEMGLSLQTGPAELRSVHPYDNHSFSTEIFLDAMIDGSDDIMVEPETGNEAAPGLTPVAHDPLQNKKRSAKFLLKLAEGRRISQVTVRDVIQGCRDICAQTAFQVKQNITTALIESGVDPSVINDQKISELYEDPFDGLSTPYIRHKFIKEHFNYVVSDHFKAIFLLYTMHEKAK